ncbi:MAG: hypothetical protein ACKVX9_03475 [Blastocatellia bacterium]
MPIFRRGGSGAGGGSRPGKKRPMGGGPGGGHGPGKTSGGKSFGAKKAGVKKKFVPKRGKKKVMIKKKAPVTSIESTGMEAYYLKELIEAETPVVIVMNNGEEIRGHVRYYDKDVFSLGPIDGSPKIFLRKESIRYMYEVED